MTSCIQKSDLMVILMLGNEKRLGEVFTEYCEKNQSSLPVLAIVQGKGTMLREESNRNLIYD